MVSHFLVVAFVISLFLSPAATTSGLQKRFVLDNTVTVLCDIDPCHHGGTCIPLFLLIGVCYCPNGWTGKTCNTPLNCHDRPCHHGGSCIDNHGSNDECQCARGWTGTTCEITDHCNSNPCHHGGSCNNHYLSFECNCAYGWKGQSCDVRVDGCSVNHPCDNGGTCTNANGNYSCHCVSGWSGDNCQTDIDECSTTTPCQNGGTCRNTAGNYNCQCPTGWTGHDCQTDMTPKCDHTCCLDAVILSQPVTSPIATNCPGTFASNEALPIACCNITSNWNTSNAVQDKGVCIDGHIPPYTPIAAYNGTFVKDSAGVFYGCIKNGSAGFMMIRQDCNAWPELKTIESDSYANTFFVIY